MSRNPFLEMLTAPEQEIPGTFWATVTATNPLRVKRDTEPVLPVTPQTLATLAVGDRVLCLWERRQVVVLGRLGGPAEPVLAYPRPNVITINGTDYAMSGSVVPPPITWAGLMGNLVYFATVAIPVPFERPPGWSFAWSVAQAQRYVVVHNSDRYPVGGFQNVRILQFNNSLVTGLERLQWQLVRA